LGFPELQYEKFAEGVARIRDTRNHGADGDIENEGDFFIAKFFYIAEKENVAKGWLKLTNGGAKYRLAIDVNKIALSGAVSFGYAARAGSESKSRASDRCFQLFARYNIERANAAVLYMQTDSLLFTSMEFTIDEEIQRARINMFANPLVWNHKAPPTCGRKS
jgi:hypothetical protein